MEVSFAEPQALGLLLAVRLAPGNVSGLNLQRQLPQGLLSQMVAEVIEKGDDVLIALQLIMHLLEAPHAVQNVELLPAFGKIDFPVDEVRVPKVDKGQVLENET